MMLEARACLARFELLRGFKPAGGAEVVAHHAADQNPKAEDPDEQREHEEHGVRDHALVWFQLRSPPFFPLPFFGASSSSSSGGRYFFTVSLSSRLYFTSIGGVVSVSR